MLTHQPCNNPSCESSDAMTVYDDGHTWCFSCNTGTWPDKESPEVRHVCRSDRTDYRSIPGKVAEWARVRTYVDTSTGSVYRREYPRGPNCFKSRTHPKKFKVEGEDKTGFNTALFPSKDAPFKPSRICTIVEGEEDVLAHMTMMGRHPVWTPPSSSGIDKWLKANYDHFMQFDEVVFVLDPDRAGAAALLKAYNVLPHEKVRVVKLSKEIGDPNDYLVKRKVDDYVRLWWSKSHWSPDSIIDSPVDFDSLFDGGESYSFEPTGIPELDNVVYGLTSSCLTLIKADEGLGKTELLGHFEYNLLKNTRHHIGVIHFEETPLRILQRFVSYELMDAVHLPECDTSKDKQKEALRNLNTDNRLHIMSVQDVSSIDGILEHIRYLASVMGCKYIFMDPVNHAGDLGDDTVTKNLDYMAKRLGKMASDLDIGIVVTAHVNDDGRVRDSKMFEKTAYIRLELSRDVEAEDEETRNTTKIVCTKNRPWATTGPAGHVLFDRASFTLSPVEPEPTSTEKGPPV